MNEREFDYEPRLRGGLWTRGIVRTGGWSPESLSQAFPDRDEITIDSLFGWLRKVNYGFPLTLILHGSLNDLALNMYQKSLQVNDKSVIWPVDSSKDSSLFTNKDKMTLAELGYMYTNEWENTDYMVLNTGNPGDQGELDFLTSDLAIITPIPADSEEQILERITTFCDRKCKCIVVDESIQIDLEKLLADRSYRPPLLKEKEGKLLILDRGFLIKKGE